MNILIEPAPPGVLVILWLFAIGLAVWMGLELTA
jgi:hypothetical protein